LLLSCCFAALVRRAPLALLLGEVLVGQQALATPA
jgi:hypothetical protein